MEFGGRIQITDEALAKMKPADDVLDELEKKADEINHKVIAKFTAEMRETEDEFLYTIIWPWTNREQFNIPKEKLREALTKYALYEKALADIPHNCSTCAHEHCHLCDEPCKSCRSWLDNNPNWKWRGMSDG